MIDKFYDFILEKFGSNEIVDKLSNFLFDKINYNLGKIILNKKIILNDVLKDFKDIEFENDIVEIEISNRFYAYVDIDKMIIENDTIKNLFIHIEFIISDKELISKQLDFRNDIHRIINHEFNHIMERYLTIIKNQRYAQSWNYGKKLQYFRNKYVEYEDVLHFIYLSLPHEMRSRVSQLSHKLKNVDKKDILYYIKKSKDYMEAEFLSDLDINFIISDMKKQQRYYQFIVEFSKIFLDSKSIDYEKNFINYMERLKIQNIKLKKKLIRTSYSYLNEGEVFNPGNGDDKDIDYSKYTNKK